MDDGGAGVSDGVSGFCCDERGTGEDVGGGLAGALSDVAVVPPSLLSELGIEGDGSTKLRSAVNVVAAVRAGTPGNVLMGTGCASRFASTG
jgi:hypothetical protein